MRKTLFLLLASFLLQSHDLFIKLDTYILQPNQKAVLSLYNGTFEKSENIITRDRMLDASFVAQGERKAINPRQWKDQDSTITQLSFTTGEPGTYVAGVSTKARNIELSAEKFNDYLRHDGVLDMLEQRKQDSLLDEDAVESYEKHVKAIYQVGQVKTNDWKVILGYPIEFVPIANPYEKSSGETLEVQLLLDGQPLSNQLVYANAVKGAHTHAHHDNGHQHDHDGTEHSHGHSHDDGNHSHSHDSENGKEHSLSHSHSDENHSHSHDSKKEEKHTHSHSQKLRTNAEGIVTVKLHEEGIYYLRTIYMTQVANSEVLTHRSKWATLTFEVGHQHGPDTHTHDHDHEHEIPTWVFILGSILIVGVLFFIFRKKQ